jgi:hypothetical protein
MHADHSLKVDSLKQFIGKGGVRDADTLADTVAVCTQYVTTRAVLDQETETASHASTRTVHTTDSK